MRLAAALMLSQVFAATSAAADIAVTFIEGAPKDRFVLSSASGFCNGAPLTVSIDLSGSAGQLVFDVTPSGAGVEVFQPFELVAGRDLVRDVTRVSDGDQLVRLSLAGLAAGADVAFTIDVDDTIGAREITVTDAEIEGASVRVQVNGQTKEARFGADATVSLACPA